MPRLHAYGIADRGQAELLRLLQLLVPVAGLDEPDDAAAVQLPAKQPSSVPAQPADSLRAAPGSVPCRRLM